MTATCVQTRAVAGGNFLVINTYFISTEPISSEGNLALLNRGIELALAHGGLFLWLADWQNTFQQLIDDPYFSSMLRRLKAGLHAPTNGDRFPLVQVAAPLT